jgi:hypothetical protein
MLVVQTRPLPLPAVEVEIALEWHADQARDRVLELLGEIVRAILSVDGAR